MAQPYQLTNGSAATAQPVVREADGAFIPDDPHNEDYQVYTAWLAVGGVPDPASTQPTPVQTYTFLQFMALFTSAEQDAIIASTDTQTRLFVIMAAGSGGIQLNNAEVIAGVNYLASTSPGPALITSERAAQILAGESPPSS
jgi:hypothetical protein